VFATQPNLVLCYVVVLATVVFVGLPVSLLHRGETLYFVCMLISGVFTVLFLLLDLFLAILGGTNGLQFVFSASIIANIGQVLVSLCAIAVELEALLNVYPLMSVKADAALVTQIQLRGRVHMTDLSEIPPDDTSTYEQTVPPIPDTVRNRHRRRRLNELASIEEMRREQARSPDDAIMQSSNQSYEPLSDDDGEDNADGDGDGGFGSFLNDKIDHEAVEMPASRALMPGSSTASAIDPSNTVSVQSAFIPTPSPSPSTPPPPTPPPPAPVTATMSSSVQSILTGTPSTGTPIPLPRELHDDETAAPSGSLVTFEGSDASADTDDDDALSALGV
jgi:hypothetical protein